jgi:hypothetical protein
MSNTKRFASLFAAVAVSSAFLGSSAHAAGGATGTPADFGALTSSGTFDRQIVIAPGSHSVNVIDGETVRFIKDGQSFNWHFSTFSGEPTLALAKIAPAGFDAAGIKVYVDADPLYQN